MTTLEKVLLVIGGAVGSFAIANRVGSRISRNRGVHGHEMRIDGRVVTLHQERLGTGGRNVYVSNDFSPDGYIGRIERTSRDNFRAYPPDRYNVLLGEPSNLPSVSIKQGHLLKNMRAASAYLLRNYIRAERRFLEREGERPFEYGG